MTMRRTKKARKHSRRVTARHGAANWKSREAGNGTRGRGFGFAKYKTVATYNAVIAEIEARYADDPYARLASHLLVVVLQQIANVHAAFDAARFRVASLAGADEEKFVERIFQIGFSMRAAPRITPSGRVRSTRSITA